MILAEPEWQFEGQFENFLVNDEVLSLFKLLIGFRNPHSSKIDFINKVALLLVQHTEDVILTERQVGSKDKLLKHSTS